VINLKKLTIFIIFFLTFLNVIFANELDVKVPSAIVIDNNTHRVLYEKDAYSKRSIASLTKIMTSIVLLENCELEDIVTVPDKATWIGGSELGLKKDDTITVYNLLIGMLLPSGNDCAYTAAIHVGGDVENFAKMMTDKAKSIGCLNTNFTNPHGLDDENHYSTAYDMGLITSYALKNKIINDIVGSKSLQVSYGKTTKIISNTNRLLKSYSLTDGVKTGYTDKADRCLITSATNNNFRIITVVLGAVNTDIRFDTAEELMKYSFNRYKLEDLSKMMNWCIRIPVIKGKKSSYELNIKDNLYYPITTNELEKVYVKQEIIKSIDKKYSLNQYLGNIKMYIDDEEIYSKNIYLNENIEFKNILNYLYDIVLKLSCKQNILDTLV
jgi:serine-type D-Ala-D-Ala carboxypeptidase (penicillin-binding protein 5/6)